MIHPRSLVYLEPLAAALGLAFAVAAPGCGSSSSSAGDGGATSGEAGAGQDGAADGASDAGMSPGDAAASGDGGLPADIRGLRYCEILAAKLNASGGVHVDVYTTFGLNDCPDAQWQALDPTAVAAQLGVTQALTNGPRYWLMDKLVGTLISTTIVTLGGIPMHQAGAIDLSLDAGSLGSPYVTRMIQRNTTVTFSSGQRVYELVDPQGKIYDMQSYTTQKVMQTEADLSNLGAALKPPAGWSFRTRVLTADLVLPTPGGIGVVVQDDNDNTYQQSQQ